MLKQSKRGQITVFIILGIIILLSTATFFYVKQKLTTFDPTDVPKQKTTTVHTFVQECLNLELRAALDRVGATGGFIDYPSQISNDPGSYLNIAPIDEAKMPYWWYAGENRIPPLDFIQAQVEQYIEQNIDGCIDNFSAVPDYEVIKTGNASVKLVFGENDVSVQMMYPLLAIKVPERNEFSLNGYDFYVKAPIRFKKVYETAKKIMDDENKDNFMEHWTMDLISLGDPKYTPLTSIDFSLKPYVWLISNIETEFKDIIEKNMQYVKFEGTSYNPLPENMPYMQNHYVWDFDNENNDYSGFKVSMTYDKKWQTKLIITPTKGGFIKSGSTQIGQYLSFIGIQTWHFTYDIVYPAIVTISDAATRSNDDYVFSFAFLVSIKNNLPFKNVYGTSVYSGIDYPTSQDMCDYLINSVNTEITVNTFNEHTNEPLKGVNLSYTCGRYTCPLGKTIWSSHGALAELKTNFPYCVVGVLEGSKQGYETKEITMRSDEPKSVELSLRPVIEISNYTFVKHLYIPDNQFSRQVGNEEHLFDDEKVVMIITAPNMTDQYVIYPNNYSVPIKFFKDGTFSYNITAYLFDENKDVILGGYQGSMTLYPQDLEDNNLIKFHMIEYMAEDDEDLGLFIAGLSSYSERINKPEFMQK